MKKIFLFAALGLIAFGTLLQADVRVADAAVSSQEIIGEEENAKRGCCSHHGGVCGCRGGRALCCDGELSPSCGCE